MSTTLADMTKEEFSELLDEVIERKLLELLGDPDEGLPIRKSLRDRLARQAQAVASGERGRPFEEVAQELG